MHFGKSSTLKAQVTLLTLATFTSTLKYSNEIKCLLVEQLFLGNWQRKAAISSQTP
jgi:hypothetical protein